MVCNNNRAILFSSEHVKNSKNSTNFTHTITAIFKSSRLKKYYLTRSARIHRKDSPRA